MTSGNTAQPRLGRGCRCRPRGFERSVPGADRVAEEQKGNGRGWRMSVCGPAGSAGSAGIEEGVVRRTGFGNRAEKAYPCEVVRS